MRLQLVGVLLALCCLVHGQLTDSQLQFLKKAAKRHIAKDKELLPRLVQMNFHDCVGGCDGCVDMSNHGNKGLDSTLEFSKKFRNDYAPQLSNADTISLLGLSALEQGAEKADGEVNVPFMIGRRDCESSNGLPARNLPPDNALNSVDILKNEFNLTTVEAVALLGCHSLGHGHENRSGFSGAWDHSPFALDNGYFKSLRGGAWTPVEVNNTNAVSTAWTNRDMDLLMLHADMALFIKFDVDGPLGTPSCNASNFCQRATTSQTVIEMGSNQTLFHQELSKAYSKMINSGDLLLVE